MSGTIDVTAARLDERRERIVDALRAEWRMIASAALRRRADEDGFDAEIRLDPVLVRAAAEQQGIPATPAARIAGEARRRAAIEECVQRVNEGLPDTDRIRSFSFVG